MPKLSRRKTVAPSDEPDAALLRDVGDWQELQKKISASLVERRKRINRQPERFRSRGVDPRGWQQHTKDVPESSIARLREHEPHYLRAGVGEMEDKLDALWGEQDPITKRLLDARPVTLAGAFSLASTWVSILGEEEDSVDDWLLEITKAAKRSLADAARLAGTPAPDPFETLAREWAEQKAECERLAKAEHDAGEAKFGAPSDAANVKLGEIETRIAETPTTTILGIVTKLRAEVHAEVDYQFTTTEKIIKTVLEAAEHLLAESEKAA